MEMLRRIFIVLACLVPLMFAFIVLKDFFPELLAVIFIVVTLSTFGYALKRLS